MSSLDSSIDERRLQRLKGKQQRMAGFAFVATLNAANRMYQGAKKRRERRTAIEEGTMTLEEATKKKRMDSIQNAAAIAGAGASLRAAMIKSRECRSLKMERAEYNFKKAEYMEMKAEHGARVRMQQAKARERRQNLSRRDEDSESSGGSPLPQVTQGRDASLE